MEIPFLAQSPLQISLGKVELFGERLQREGRKDGVLQNRADIGDDLIFVFSLGGRIVVEKRFVRISAEEGDQQNFC